MALLVSAGLVLYTAWSNFSDVLGPDLNGTDILKVCGQMQIVVPKTTLVQVSMGHG